MASMLIVYNNTPVLSLFPGSSYLRVLCARQYAEWPGYICTCVILGVDVRWLNVHVWTA